MQQFLQETFLLSNAVSLNIFKLLVVIIKFSTKFIDIFLRYFKHIGCIELYAVNDKTIGRHRKNPFPAIQLINI